MRAQEHTTNQNVLKTLNVILSLTAVVAAQDLYLDIVCARARVGERAQRARLRLRRRGRWARVLVLDEASRMRLQLAHHWRRLCDEQRPDLRSARQ